MLILRKGVTGININDLNELYQANLSDAGAPNLSKAFDWNKTKEGYQFWSFVNGIAKVVPEVDKIREQLKYCPVPFQECIGRELDKVSRNRSKTLRFAFKWAESPQGEAYWHLVSDLIQYYSNQNGAEVVEYNPAVANGHGERVLMS